MKDAEKYLLSMLLVCGFFPSCVRYDRMTHLSEEELEWITNRHEGEIMLFESQDGTVDTIKVWDICIRNDTDRINWMYWQLGGTEYIACGMVGLLRNSETGEAGSFAIIKKQQEKPFWVSADLCMRTLSAHVPLKLISMRVDNIELDDVIYFDESLMMPVNQYNPPIPIVSYAWSKKYGLVQYTFQDGTTFSRIDLK